MIFMRFSSSFFSFIKSAFWVFKSRISVFIAAISASALLGIFAILPNSMPELPIFMMLICFQKMDMMKPTIPSAIKIKETRTAIITGLVRINFSNKLPLAGKLDSSDRNKTMNAPTRTRTTLLPTVSASFMASAL
jgi:hypothetical protein